MGSMMIVTSQWMKKPKEHSVVLGPVFGLQSAKTDNPQHASQEIQPARSAMVLMTIATVRPTNLSASKSWPPT